MIFWRIQLINQIAFNDFQKVIYVLTTSLVRMNPYK